MPSSGCRKQPTTSCRSRTHLLFQGVDKLGDLLVGDHRRRRRLPRGPGSHGHHVPLRPLAWKIRDGARVRSGRTGQNSGCHQMPLTHAHGRRHIDRATHYSQDAARVACPCAARPRPRPGSAGRSSPTERAAALPLPSLLATAGAAVPQDHEASTCGFLRCRRSMAGCLLLAVATWRETA